MKKFSLLFLIGVLVFLVSCSSYDNNDLSEIESILDNFINLENSYDYNSFDSQEAVTDYLMNYQDLFTEETKYSGFIMNYSEFETYDNLRILEAQFMIRNIDINYLDKRAIEKFMTIYEQTVEDLKSLIGENYLNIDIHFGCANGSYVLISTGEHPDGMNIVDIFQKQETIELSDIRKAFRNWQKLLEIEGLDMAFLYIGETEMVQRNLSIQLIYNQNKYYFGRESEYGLSREDVNQIIMDNTDGLTLHE